MYRTYFPLCLGRAQKNRIWICFEGNRNIPLLPFIKMTEQPDICFPAFPEKIVSFQPLIFSKQINKTNS
jgi:hypothetical protein